MNIWDNLLNETDREVIRLGGYGQPRGMGSRPVLMIIDPQYNYAGANQPILNQLDKWPSGAGESAWEAVEKIKPLLSVARRKNIPVIYTKHVQDDIKFDGFAAKVYRDQSQYLKGAKGTMIIEELAPFKGDIIIDKSYASAFYGTPLLSYLVKLQADSIIIVGGTTSGCVRAACVDAISRNYNVAVLYDCVYDRISASHKVALLDLWMKYCDVISSKDAIEYLTKIHKNI